MVNIRKQRGPRLPAVILHFNISHRELTHTDTAPLVEVERGPLLNGAGWHTSIELRGPSAVMDQSTKIVYVVHDDYAGTVLFDNQADADAEADLLVKAWDNAGHLTIVKGEAPAHLDGHELARWCRRNLVPTLCEA